MKKKKVLGIVIATVIGISSIIPAFADTVSSQDKTTNTAAQTETKKLTQEEKFDRITKRAAKLGIDITGLTNEQARDKIRKAEASKLGIDITGLSKEEAKAKIKSAMDTKKQEVSEKIKEKATKLGIDISGLTNKEAREKIKETRQSAKATTTSVLQ